MNHREIVRRGGAVLATVAALLALRAASLWPVGRASAESGVLRLSWSARPERLESCRRLSDAELAERPAHMRMRWECEGRFASYALEVYADSQRLDSDTVRGGGLRHDRSMHVFREFNVPAGSQRVLVSLTRIEAESRPDTTEQSAVASGAAAANRETREAQERRARRGEALPAVLTIDTTLTIPPRGVILVSYNDRDRHLTLRTP